MSKTIRAIYTVFLGMLIALFVGVGIDAFYEGPKYPEYPFELKEYPNEKDKNYAQELKKYNQAQAEYDRKIKKYESENKEYSRNVSILSLAASVIILISALTFANKMYLISDGLLLGGLFALIYSLIRGFEADSSMFRFMVVSVGLILSIIIGYIKLIKSDLKLKIKNPIDF